MDARGDSQAEPDEAQLVVLEALWTGVINSWDEDDRHAKFLDQARLMGALPQAARHYGRLRDDPERGEGAKKRLAAIAMLAMNELYATQSKRPTKKLPGWLVAVAVSVCVSLLGWAAWAFAVGAR